MKDRFEQVFAFILELEKLKDVQRKIMPVGLNRYENSAEHSWQIALLALSLAPYASGEIDTHRVITMLLLHDVVEIDTGDKFAYSPEHDDYENEHASAKRIFALLPKETGQEYLAIWEEFESAETDDAKFSKAIDRLMPVLQNLNNGGQSWLQHDISVSQILTKNKAVAELNSELWEIVSQQVIGAGKRFGLKP